MAHGGIPVRRRNPDLLFARWALIADAGISLSVVFLALLLARLWVRVEVRRSRLPAGNIVYRDTDPCVKPARPLRSHRYGLLGRPDYLISSGGSLIPAELKKSRCPAAGPHDHHAAQLLGYCLLVENAMGKPVPYGVLRYADRDVLLQFTSERRQWVEAILSEICVVSLNGAAVRNHDSPARCRKCSLRGSCTVSLV
jgi:CRISPR-associated exonuclease Cas4